MAAAPSPGAYPVAEVLSPAIRTVEFLLAAVCPKCGEVLDDNLRTVLERHQAQPLGLIVRGIQYLKDRRFAVIDSSGEFARAANTSASWMKWDKGWRYCVNADCESPCGRLRVSNGNQGLQIDFATEPDVRSFVGDAGWSSPFTMWTAGVDYHRQMELSTKRMKKTFSGTTLFLAPSAVRKWTIHPNAAALFRMAGHTVDDDINTLFCSFVTNPAEMERQRREDCPSGQIAVAAGGVEQKRSLPRELEAQVNFFAMVKRLSRAAREAADELQNFQRAIHVEIDEGGRTRIEESLEGLVAFLATVRLPERRNDLVRLVATLQDLLAKDPEPAIEPPRKRLKPRDEAALRVEEERAGQPEPAAQPEPNPNACTDQGLIDAARDCLPQIHERLQALERARLQTLGLFQRTVVLYDVQQHRVDSATQRLRLNESKRRQGAVLFQSTEVFPHTIGLTQAMARDISVKCAVPAGLREPGRDEALHLVPKPVEALALGRVKWRATVMAVAANGTLLALGECEVEDLRRRFPRHQGTLLDYKDARKKVCEAIAEIKRLGIRGFTREAMNGDVAMVMRYSPENLNATKAHPK